MKVIAGLALAWAVAFWLPFLFVEAAAYLYHQACAAGMFMGPVAGMVWDVVFDCAGILRAVISLTALAISVAVPLAMLLRMIARARLRAGMTNPLDRLRAWTVAHPRATRGIVALPAFVWSATVVVSAATYVHQWGRYFMYGELAGSDAVRHLHTVYGLVMGGFACAMVLASVGLVRLARAGHRRLLAPTLGDEPVATAVEPVRSRRLGVDAVAVTAETRAAVVAMALLPVVTLLVVGAAKLGDGATEACLAAYVAVALMGAMAFQRASRIAVGVDGVFVSGTSRSRFFAYRDLDDVRAHGSDLELVRRGRVMLRLQLHGKDARQRDAVALRIREAVETARQRGTAAVGDLVAAVPEAKLARIVEGAGGYRSPSVTRKQLWKVVEGPEHDAGTRALAARALLAAGDGAERVRLRVAADGCVQPRVRVALLDLADEERAEDEEAAPASAARRLGA